MTFKIHIAGQVILALVLGACSSRAALPAPTSELATPTSTPSTDAESVINAPETAPPSPLESTKLPPPYSGPSSLVAIPEPPVQIDRKSPLSLPSAGFIPLAFVSNANGARLGDLDVFEMGDRLYAVQVRDPGGYVLTEVTDPGHPAYLGSWKVLPASSGEHVKAFRQDRRWYLVLPLEASDWENYDLCGLAIIEITDPLKPVLQGLHNGATADADANWCNVHAAEIITDEGGNAEYLLAAAVDTFDLRVLDIRQLDNIRETNVYHLHAHPHGNDDSWAHFTTVVGDRVYVAHWRGGVMILDKAALLSGEASEEVQLTSPGSIAAPDFVVHDAYPSADGGFLFVNDAFLSAGGLRLFDIRDLANPRPVLTVDFEELRSQRHTLVVQDDLLFVPWFQEGVRVFRYDVSQPNKPLIEQVAFQSVREAPLDTYDGVARLRLHPCQVNEEMRTCVFASDMTMGLIILALDDD